MTNELMGILKSVPGHGQGLPGDIIPQVNGQPIPVGNPVPGFPATQAELNALTSLQLSELAMLYNDDFGVLAGDNLGTKLHKFRMFVTM